MSELEERWRDLGEFIREQRHIGHLSLRKLSEMAGVSNPYLSQIERGLRKPSAEILQQIARALEISSETLYIRAGILEERPEGADLVAEIRRDPWIDEEQKRSLIQVYESFRAASPLVAAALAAAESAGDDAAGDADEDEAAATSAASATAAPTPASATDDDPPDGDVDAA